MKKHILFCMTVVGLLLLSNMQIQAQEKTLEAGEILARVDNVVNAPKDQDLKVKLILTDKNGEEKVREMLMIQKGFDKRLVKFLSPADQKGIGVLSLPDDIMYLYLPAFKKVRRIASHVKNTKFAGTDFTYEDMEAVRYADKWIPHLSGKEDNSYILQLTPKEGSKSDYAKLVMWVRSDIFYPTKIEHYDKGGRLCKVMTRGNIEKVNDYWVSKESEMEDIKAKHKSKMMLVDVKYDVGLINEMFTERYLSR